MNAMARDPHTKVEFDLDHSRDEDHPIDPKARVLVNSHAIYADCGPSGLMLGHAGFRLMPLRLAPAYAG